MNWLKAIFGSKNRNQIQLHQKLDQAIDFAVESYLLQRQLVENRPFNAQPKPIVWTIIHPLISNYILYYAIARLEHHEIRLNESQRYNFALSIKNRYPDTQFDFLHFYKNPNRLAHTGRLFGNIDGTAGYKKLLIFFLQYLPRKISDKGTAFCDELINEGYELDISRLDKIVHLIDASFIEIENTLNDELANSILKDLFEKLDKS